MDTIINVLFLTIYYFNILFLFLYGIHLYIMLALYKKGKSNCLASIDPKKIKNYPKVTIQLPIFNELYVCERLIESVIKIKYPKNKLEIQVLDDSTDETVKIASDLVQKFKSEHYDIHYYHRTNRIGHKGGALREGLEKSKGEYVAIFDADFIPSPDFLMKTVPCFLEDPKLGMVQTRWGHINSDYSLLTQAQAIGIDGHFIIDQVARGGNCLFMNFNGTAGIWRKKCIFDAGNWQDDTLTEDFDLSYRAELKGWKFKYLQDVINPAELPVLVSAFKSQQFRWAKGSIQTAIKLIPAILKSKQSFNTKIEALVHLTNYAVHPLMLINILTAIPILIKYDYHFYGWYFYISAALFTIATLGPMIFYAYSQYILYSDWKQRIWRVPFMMLTGCGVAVNNTKAFLEAIIGKKTAFVRTPKLKIETKNDNWSNKKYHTPFDKLVFIEAFFAIYSIFGIYIAISKRHFSIIPILAIFAISFMYIIFTSFIQKYMTAKQATA